MPEKYSSVDIVCHRVGRYLANPQTLVEKMFICDGGYLLNLRNTLLNDHDQDHFLYYHLLFRLFLFLIMNPLPGNLQISASLSPGDGDLVLI